MHLHEYETTVVLKPDIPPEAIEEVSGKVQEAVKKADGEVLNIEQWGKKRLAYDIKKQGRGVFLYYSYLGPSTLVANVERILRLHDNVLRFLTKKLASRVDRQQRLSSARSAGQQAAEPAEAPAQ